MAKEEFIEFVYTMHLQNTNGRESTNEMFRLGIEVAYDEMNKICPKELNIKFASEEELKKHIQMDMPYATRQTKKAKASCYRTFITELERVKTADKYIVITIGKKQIIEFLRLIINIK